MGDGFGKYDVCAVSGSIYCYQDTRVLRNRFGIQDGQQLRALETDISAVRQTELLLHGISGRFTVNHLCKIHRQLLGDVYSFAGHFRREDIAKGETRFLNYDAIPGKLRELLAQLKAEGCLTKVGVARLPDRAAYYMAELNYIHPFREGNGRAIREFVWQLLLKNGYAVHWDNVPTETLLQAMVDSVYDAAGLKAVLEKCIERENI